MISSQSISLLFSTILTSFIPSIYAQCAVGSNVIVGTGPCTYSIVATPFFFSDGSFRTRVETPLRILSGDFVYMSVHLNRTSEPTDHLLLETCYATKRRHHLVHTINDTVVDFPGCPSRRWNSVVTMTNNGRSSVVTIRFPIFFLFPDEPEFYLHCSVGACENCEPEGCSSLAPIPQTYTKAAAVVTIGPIQRTDFSPNDNSSAAQNTTGFLIAACVLAGVIFLAIVGLLVYCTCCSSSQKKSNFTDDASKNSSVPVLINKKRILSYSEASTYPPSQASPSNGTVVQNTHATMYEKQHEIPV